jgi:glycerol-3-phosphate acyltransferase PlsY
VLDELGLIVGAYVLGSFPFIYLLGRLNGVDLRESEDMHIALWRDVGRLQGFIGVVFDFAKGVIAVVVARAVGFDDGWIAFAGVAAVAGQMWPVFMKFQGEKGNSTGVAMSGALDPASLLIAAVPMATGFLVRTVPRFRQREQSLDERLKFGGPPSLSLPVGMASGFAVLPLAAWGWGRPWEMVVAFAGLFLLIMLRRVTDGLREHLRQPSGKRRMLLNKFLFDRSEI